uniref:Pheromone B alpha 2 receptor n=1 Tax=Schizophyllum commune TaxID=5334 RepID=BAR2_SCHCO|nr:RecName: Full=Pheromone B alpha 2 receptor [Schizophyllum commune]CAA62595.4 B alpha pheromone receptor [Schizophyllum commune]
MLDPTYPAFPIFAFLGIVCCLVPLPWHLQSWNSGTCFLMIWTAVACLNMFVNSIIWKDHAQNVAPVWCEISIRITLGASVGIPASSLCIVRRLYSIAKKFRAVMVDALICVLFPILYIILQIVVQGHRFNILENIGCFPAIINTPLTYPLTFMWPVLIGVISFIYSTLALIQFNRHRLQFTQFLHSNSTLSVSRYLRLMALAMTEMMCTTPMGVFVIILNAKATPVSPYVSWAVTHYGYGRIDQVPAIIWRSNRLLVASYELTRWSSPAIALIFFFYFGFAQEARRNYAAAWGWVRRAVGLPERVPSLPTTKKPFSSSDKGSGFAEKFAAKAKGLSSFNVKDFTSEFTSKAHDFTFKAKQYTLPRPMPQTPSSSGFSSSDSTRFGSSVDGKELPSPTTKEFSSPIPIHLSGMQTLASFDSNKDLPSPPAYDVEAQYGPYNIDNRVSYHIADAGVRASYPMGVAYSSDSEHRRIVPQHSTVPQHNTADEPASPALPDTPSSCSSSATFSTLQSRDFIVLPSTTDVTRGTGSLPTRRSPAGPPRLPSLSQLFGISSMTRERDVEAQVEDVATGTASPTTTAPAPASTTIAPASATMAPATTTTAPTTIANIQRGEPDVPASPRTHRASV